MPGRSTSFKLEDHSPTHNKSKERVSSYILMSLDAHWRISEQTHRLVSSDAWTHLAWRNWLVCPDTYYAYTLVDLLLACTVGTWTLPQKNFTNWNNRNYRPFLPDHELQPHNCPLCLCLKMSQLIFLFNVILYFLLCIKMSYLFVYLINLLIYYFLKSVIHHSLSISVFYRVMHFWQIWYVVQLNITYFGLVY